MREVSLTQGEVALVDDEEYDRVMAAGPWHLTSTSSTGIHYAQHTGSRPRMTALLMHRLILNTQPGQGVDHVNGDGLDNRHVNLRLATKAQNQANTAKRPGYTSCYKGVYWDSRRGLWYAHIKLDQRTHFLGRFDSEEDAAGAYDVAARMYFGEFARTNFQP